MLLGLKGSNVLWTGSWFVGRFKKVQYFWTGSWFKKTATVLCGILTLSGCHAANKFKHQNYQVKYRSNCINLI